MADDEYERLAEKNELSYEEAVALKDEIRRRGETGEPFPDVVLPPSLRGWFVTTVADHVGAVEFLNRPPQQQPGEASVTSLPNGMVDVYYFLRGS
jgi:hypothetical protein